MTKKPREDGCRRYHIWLDVNDADWFSSTFGDDLGFSKSIRAVMKSYRRGIEAQIAGQRQPGRKLSEAELESIVKGALPPLTEEG